MEISHPFLRIMGSMLSLIYLVGLAIAIFVSTNVDGLFVLLGFFSDAKYRSFQVVAGQYIGNALLFAVSALAALATIAVPVDEVGWLGLIPIAIGCKKLYDLKSRPEINKNVAESRANSRGMRQIVAVAGVCIANGGDNIGVWTPQFAVHSGSEILVIGIVFVMMTGIWCLIAQRILEHPSLRTPIRVYGHRVVPFVLILLGVLTMRDGGIFKLLYSKF